MGTQYIQPYKREKILMLAQHYPPLSYREIAGQVGVGEVTVRRTVQRAGIKKQSARMGPKKTGYKPATQKNNRTKSPRKGSSPPEFSEKKTHGVWPRKGSKPPEFSERNQNKDYKSIVDRFDRKTGELITAPPDYSGYKITKL